MIRTEVGNFVQPGPRDIVQMLAVVTFTSDIDTQDDSLVNHLIKVDCGTQVLGHLGLGCDEKIPTDMHQLVENLQVVLQPLVVLDNESRALLGCDALIRIIQTGQRPNGASGEVRDGGGEYSRQPYPDSHIPR